MSSSSSHSYVHYFIPYDGDVEDHPNLFLVKKPVQKVTLGDVLSVSPRGSSESNKWSSSDGAIVDDCN